MKRAMNKIVFTKLFIDGKEITGHELGQAVRDVVEAQHMTGTFSWDKTRAATASTTPNPSNPIPEGEVCVVRTSRSGPARPDPCGSWFK
ncbi:MAG: hypothetical protein DLM59_09430 [Pseudonocardiales bacterium]|nr:MAG: hypothetical protein DLM59_09430 [Pseudonocardiales bacterium]